MTEQTQPQALIESLSALMDNQASELELQRVLKACNADADIKATWSRYQMTSAALRNELPLLASGDFASRISAAIDNEETYSQQPVLPVFTTMGASNVTVLPTHWWQHVGRMAIAASVAGALVIGVQQYQTIAPQTSDLVANAPVVSPVTLENKAADLPAGINAPALSARTVAVQSGYESRPQENRQMMFVPRQEAAPVYNEEVSSYVNQLIEEHSNNASLNSGQGMLPFTRVILTEED